MKWIRKKKPHPRKCENCDGDGYFNLNPIYDGRVRGPTVSIPCGECKGKGVLTPYAVSTK